MNQVGKRLILLCMVVQTSLLAGPFSGFVSTVKGIGSAFKQFGEGMAQSFGMNPPGYHYSFRVFNNTRGPVSVEARRLRKYQGMMIKKGSIEEYIIGPSEDTASKFNSVSLYLEVVLRFNGDEVFTDPIVNLLPNYKKDDDTHFYNVYENASGAHGEKLGTGKTTTEEFLGSIFNSLSIAQTITFRYADQKFSVKLDPDSYNLLQSDSTIPQCIRPKVGTETLDFGKTGAVLVPTEGLATGQQKKGKWENKQPMNYHYEILGQKNPFVVTTGFTPGHFTQPTTGRVRDITPVRCLVWNKSPDQVDSTDDFVAVEQKRGSVWVAYGTPGWANKTRSLDSTIMAEVPSGQALQFFLIRPLIDATQRLTEQELLQTKDLEPTKSFAKENTIDTLGIQLDPVNIFEGIKKKAPTTSKASLFIVALDTNDSAKAKSFLQNLLDGKISLPQAPSLTSGTLTEDIKSTLLAQKLSTDVGQLKDTATGVGGYLLAHDVFTPYGNGFGPYYYSVEPPKVMIATVFSTLVSYLDKKVYQTDSAAKEVKSTIGQWVSLAAAQATKQDAIKAVYDKVLAYLKENGSDTIFGRENDGNPDKNSFNWAGNMGLNFVVTGPNGIVNAPLQWHAGVNHFVYTGPSMPSIMGDDKKKKIIWKPSKTVDLAGKEPTYLPSAPKEDSQSAPQETTNS